jgi:hypothetical protein
VLTRTHRIHHTSSCKMFPSLVHRAKSLRHHRSHKELRSDDMRSFHARQISSGTTCSWTSRPSGESGRPSTSKDALSSSPASDWDPLRLHPPTEPARSPYIHPGSRVPESYQQAPPRSFREFQASTGPRLEIDDGFDFGFSTPIAHPPNVSSAPQLPLTSASASRPRTATSTNSDSHHLHAPSSWSSPALSSASSEWDVPDSPSAAHARLAPALQAPSTPTRSASSSDASPVRPVTPRHPGNFSTLTTDYFITRGGWKRRGIVFAAEEAKGPSEDECFEIP